MSYINALRNLVWDSDNHAAALLLGAPISSYGRLNVSLTCHALAGRLNEMTDIPKITAEPNAPDRMGALASAIIPFGPHYAVAAVHGRRELSWFVWDKSQRDEMFLSLDRIIRQESTLTAAVRGLA